MEPARPGMTILPGLKSRFSQRPSEEHLEDLGVGSWPVVGCMEWWACHSVLAQFLWDTDAVTEVCMTGPKTP